MRSRYSAYVLAREDYLLATWHPSSRPRDVELVCDPPVQWLGLKILDVVSGGREDEQGQVEFVARYKQRGKAGRLHERSRFLKQAGRWFYVDGEVS